MYSEFQPGVLRTHLPNGIGSGNHPKSLVPLMWCRTEGRKKDRGKAPFNGNNWTEKAGAWSEKDLPWN